MSEADIADAPPRSAVFLLVIAMLTGCQATRPVEPRGEPGISGVPGFRLMTYNVNWGVPRPESALQAIIDADADIVCLQETNDAWNRYLRPRLADRYPYIEFRESRGRMGGGLAFLSKLPVREVACIGSDTGWFDGWIVAFDTPAGPVQVLNTHLQPPVDDRGSVGIGGWLGTGEHRRREIERFAGHLDRSSAAIAAGDFNAEESGDAVRWLAGQGFVNALPEFDRRTPTFRWPAGPFTIRRRLDHVMYDGLSCRGAWVMKTGASDHWPIVADFTIVER